MSHICFHCQNELTLGEKVFRQDQCPHCGSDLHCCQNCRFYDEYAHNKCREPQAEYVLDRERSNFCDFFQFRVSDGGRAPSDAKEKAKADWEALFRKK